MCCKRYAAVFTCKDAKKYLNQEFSKTIYLFAKQFCLNNKNVNIDSRTILNLNDIKCEGEVTLGYLLLNLDFNNIESIYVNQEDFNKYFKEFYTVVV